MEIKKYIAENEPKMLEDLFSLIRIPSISAKPEHHDDMLACAERWAQLLLEVGADEALVMPSAGNPIVFGQKMIDPKAKTVLIYAHYDVMPAEPLELWKSSPFEPEIRDGHIWARGADDDKGQSFIQVKAFEYLVKNNLLTHNVKFIFEGEEEIGSPSLEGFCQEHKELLKDVEFKADGSIVANYAEEINITMDQMISAGMGMMPSTDGIKWKTSPANLAYWYLKGEQIYVVLNIPAIVEEAMKDSENSNMTSESIMNMVEMVKGMSGADIKKLLDPILKGLGENNILSKLDISKIADSDIERLIGYITEGFPLNYKTSQLEIKEGEEVVRTVNDISIYLDKSIFDIFMPAIYPMLPDVDTLLKGMEIDFYGQKMPLWPLLSTLTGLQSMTEIEDIWKVTTVFNLGINLGDGSYKPAK
jgi:hypothetical protein